jgi:hypothetical protein
MVCTHLKALEEALQARGIPETYRGQAWSQNCREWVYFDCYIDLPAVRRAFPLDACVREHIHRGTHDGSERGFECTLCLDGVMGLFESAEGSAVFKG